MINKVLVRKILYRFVVDTETKQERLVNCKQCEHFTKSKKRCKICKCFVEKKAKLRNQHCPKGKW